MPFLPLRRQFNLQKKILPDIAFGRFPRLSKYFERHFRELREKVMQYYGAKLIPVILVIPSRRTYFELRFSIYLIR